MLKGQLIDIVNEFNKVYQDISNAKCAFVSAVDSAKDDIAGQHQFVALKYKDLEAAIAKLVILRNESIDE